MRDREFIKIMEKLNSRLNVEISYMERKKRLDNDKPITAYRERDQREMLPNGLIR